MNTQYAHEAAQRLLGCTAAKEIKFIHHKLKDTFVVSTSNSCLEIAGDTVGTMLCGLNWYLKHVAKLQLTWQTPTAILPTPIPLPPQPIVQHSPFTYRYYLNYCTYSYTMPFWDWTRWEQELDLMALGGINMALSLTGQEAALRDALLALGFTKQQCTDYFTGPAHLAWFFMGNMTSFGGDLPEQWFTDRVALANKIHARMAELGITPVFPGFYGTVPTGLKDVHPEVTLLPQGDWCGFDRPAFLPNSDPFFDTFAKAYYSAQRTLFGDVTRFFTAEPFHEGGDAGCVDLPQYGQAILRNMRNLRPDAVWVLQAWDANPYMALFDNLEKQDILILNLLAGRIADFDKTTNDFGGHPWIWCPVHSYGGRNPLYGFLRTMAREPFALLQQKNSLCGIGLAPESLETNPVFYDLFWDITFRSEAPNVGSWLSSYVLRRYGKCTDNSLNAWRILEDSVYNSFVPQPGGAESFFCARPDFSISSVSTWGPKNINYDITFVKQAAALLFADYAQLKENEHYQYDLVDVCRQALANSARTQYAKAMYFLAQKQLQNFKDAAALFLKMLDAQENLLRCRPEFSLNQWLDTARTCGAPYGLSDAFEHAAKTQITVWGTRAASVSLHDYACKEWSGLCGSFYLMRWQTFFERIQDWLCSGRTLDVTASASHDWSGKSAQADERFEIDWYEIEMQWVNAHSPKAAPAPNLVSAVETVLGLLL